MPIDLELDGGPHGVVERFVASRGDLGECVGLHRIEDSVDVDLVEVFHAAGQIDMVDKNRLAGQVLDGQTR